MKINLLVLQLLMSMYQCTKGHFYTYGDNIPLFRMEDIEGNSINSSDYLGENLLLLLINSLDFENKRLLTYADILYKKYKDVSFSVCGISILSKEASQDLVNQYNIAFPIIPDINKKIYNSSI